MTKDKIELSDGVIWSLWGVVLAFAIQVLYDSFGTPFYTNIMPKTIWGTMLMVILVFLVLAYMKPLLRQKSSTENREQHLNPELRLSLKTWIEKTEQKN